VDVAGCLGDGDSEGQAIECSTVVREFSDSQMQTAGVGIKGGATDNPIAKLEVTLASDAVPDGPQGGRIGRISVTNSRDELVHKIPLEEPTSDSD